MKLTLAILIPALVLSACLSVEIKKYNEEKNRYLKTKYDTLSMSEYDRQRYYDYNQLGLIEKYT